MGSTKVSDLQFAHSKHRYTDPRTGQRLVSVTSVVGNWDGGDKVGRGAAAAVALQKQGLNYREIWDGKRDLGSRLHENIGDWALGRSTQVAATDEGHLDAFMAFCHAKHPIWLQTERAVVSKLGYGGRFDLIAEIEGEYWLLDPKTGKEYKPELTMQLAGYANADGMIVYTAQGMAVELEHMPFIQRWGGLYLEGDGTARLVECAPTPEEKALAFGAFRSLLEVRLWADSIKSKKAV